MTGESRPCIRCRRVYVQHGLCVQCRMVLEPEADGPEIALTPYGGEVARLDAQKGVR